MIVLTQLGWSATAPGHTLEKKLAVARERAAAKSPSDEPLLVLLPVASLSSADIPDETRLCAQLGALAGSLDVFLAGAARVRLADATVTMRGFLLDPAGARMLWVAKTSPNLAVGFDNCSCALGQEAEFPVANTPFGQIGLLVGDDVHFPQYARSLAFHGAEILLNPSEERLDDQLEVRQCSRLARASENTAYLAMASAREQGDPHAVLVGPSVTALYSYSGKIVVARGGEDFVYPDLDIQALRRARVNPHRSMPALVRANVYAHDYARAVSAKRHPDAADGKRSPTSVADWRTEARRRMHEQESRQAPRPSVMEPQYEALLVQHCARLIPLDRAIDAAAIMHANLDEALELAGSRANIPSVRLVVFPEFWLTGPGGIGGVQRGVADMERLAIRYPGPVFDRIAQFAQKHQVWVAFQNFEVHERLAHRVFNSAFLVNDAGNLVHTYRKNQCADVWGLLPDTTPGSILAQYLDIFGQEALFPVANTPLGRIANMVCFDNMIPEVAHGLRRAGAEIILHSSSEPHGGGGREVWDNCRRMRAFENGCYVLSAIDGGEHLHHNSETLTFFRRGHTRIVRFDGTVEGTVDGPGPVAFRVGIDLAALWRARTNPFSNYAIWDDPEVYVRHYQGDVGLPNELWAGDPLKNPYLGAAALKLRIETYLQRGIYVGPTAPVRRASIPDSV